MAQVMYDKAIMFEGQIYSVTQTWDGSEIVLSVTPENDALRQLIIDLLRTRHRITLDWRGSYFEIVQPS
jgi:hypothetical protein